MLKHGLVYLPMTTADMSGCNRAFVIRINPSPSLKQMPSPQKPKYDSPNTDTGCVKVSVERGRRPLRISGGKFEGTPPPPLPL
jgi:hypothetical protein